ncbi:MAG: hypothetical protein ACPF8V_03365, partial [Luteibaculum sp.]
MASSTSLDINQRLKSALLNGYLDASHFPELDEETINLLNGQQKRLESGDLHRLNEINDLIAQYCTLDFSKIAPITSNEDQIDAIALGLNTLREEFEHNISELEKNQEFLLMAQRLGGIGSWSYDEKTGKSELTKQLLEI